MKTILLAAYAAIAFAAPASAQMLNCYALGGQQFCNGSNGYSSNQYELGGQIFGHDNRGNSWNSYQLGGQTFTNIQPGFQRRRGW